MKPWISLRWDSSEKASPNTIPPQRFPCRRILFLILLLSLIIRWYNWEHTHIINPDGTLYIDQARMISHGYMAETTLADLRFLSPYPFAVAAAYPLLGDWETAARGISLLFGTLTLIPLFLLARKFLRPETALGLILIFALMPTFVVNSAEAVRDPMAWFFGACGLYLMIHQTQTKRWWAVCLAGASFVLAAWSRVEMGLFFGVSLLFLLFLEEKARFRKCLVFCLPLLAFLLLNIWISAAGQAVELNALRIDEIKTKPGGLFTGYQGVREGLSHLAQDQATGPLRFFLQIARSHVLLVAFGEIVSTLLKAVHYPFALLFIAAFTPLRREIGKNRCLFYLTFLAAAALGILYVHLLDQWISEARFFVFALLPASVIMGLGLDRCLSFLSRRFQLQGATALFIAAAVVMALTLPKNLKEREADKGVFKAIGALIASREDPGRLTPVAASDPIQRWITFYANPRYNGPTPINGNQLRIEALVGSSYERLMQNLRAQRIPYLLWEEKRWPDCGYTLEKSMNRRDLKMLGHWEHRDTGRMILFEVQP